eukprot:Rmarinus@m.12047
MNPSSAGKSPMQSGSRAFAGSGAFSYGKVSKFATSHHRSMPHDLYEESQKLLQAQIEEDKRIDAENFILETSEEAPTVPETAFSKLRKPAFTKAVRVTYGDFLLHGDSQPPGGFPRPVSPPKKILPTAASVSSSDGAEQQGSGSLSSSPAASPPISGRAPPEVEADYREPVGFVAANPLETPQNVRSEERPRTAPPDRPGGKFCLADLVDCDLPIESFHALNRGLIDMAVLSRASTPLKESRTADNVAESPLPSAPPPRAESAPLYGKKEKKRLRSHSARPSKKLHNKPTRPSSGLSVVRSQSPPRLSSRPYTPASNADYQNASLKQVRYPYSPQCLLHAAQKGTTLMAERPISASSELLARVSSLAEGSEQTGVVVKELVDAHDVVVTRRYFLQGAPLSYNPSTMFMKHFDVVLRHDEALTLAGGAKKRRADPRTQYYLDFIGRPGTKNPLGEALTKPYSNLELEDLVEWVSTVQPRTADDYVPMFTICQEVLCRVLNNQLGFHLQRTRRISKTMATMEAQLAKSEKVSERTEEKLVALEKVHGTTCVKQAEDLEVIQEQLGDQTAELEKLRRSVLRLNNELNASRARIQTFREILDAERVKNANQRVKYVQRIDQLKQALEQAKDDLRTASERAYQRAVIERHSIEKRIRLSRAATYWQSLLMKLQLTDALTAQQRRGNALESLCETQQSEFHAQTTALEGTVDRLEEDLRKNEKLRKDLEKQKEQHRKQMKLLEQMCDEMETNARNREEEFSEQIEDLKSKLLLAKVCLTCGTVFTGDEAVKAAGNPLAEDNQDGDGTPVDLPAGEMTGEHVMRSNFFEKFIGKKTLLQCLKPKPPVQALSRKEIFKFISDVFKEKLKADEIDDREDNPRDPMGEFVSEFVLHQYGIKPLAKQQIQKLVVTFRERFGDPRVRTFARLCGITSPAPLTTASAILSALHTVIDAFTRSDAKAGPGRFWKMYESGDDYMVDSVVITSAAMKAFDALPSMKSKMKASALSKLEEYMLQRYGDDSKVYTKFEKKVRKDGSVPYKVLLDVFLESLLTTIENIEAEKFVDVFRACDQNGDGDLNLQEFCDVLMAFDDKFDFDKAVEFYDHRWTPGVPGLLQFSFLYREEIMAKEQQKKSSVQPLTQGGKKKRRKGTVVAEKKS